MDHIFRPPFFRAQDFLREKLITEDSFTWKIPQDGSKEEGLLRYVGGVDISFSKDDPSMACGTLVVLDFSTLQVVYEDFSLVTVQVPYVPGFLAFREVPSFFFFFLTFPFLVSTLFDSALVLNDCSYNFLGPSSSGDSGENEKEW